jgi:hypothetical protein
LVPTRFVPDLISQAGRDDKTQDDKAAMRRLRVWHLRA